MSSELSNGKSKGKEQAGARRLTAVPDLVSARSDISVTRLAFGALLLGCALLSLALPAQTLARPGWTGSGMTGEPWWRSAVFYRIAPERFQDSDGDGVGDLRGIAERLDYLQALGVDAVVLQLPFDDAGSDDLQAELSRRHIRLVIGLDRGGGEAGAAAPADSLQAEARQWLSRGAAGILLPPASGAKASLAGEDALRRAIRQVAAEYPGERVVIAGPLPGAEPVPLHLGGRALRLEGPQLSLRTLPLAGDARGPLSSAGVFASLREDRPGEGAPLLEFSVASPGTSGSAAPAEQTVGNAEIAAAVLLTQRSAVLLDYGQELGLPEPAQMPWTLTNVTPPAPQAEAPAAAPEAVVYGPYRPYVPPPPKPKAPAPPAGGEPALPDPDTLAGFSTQPTPAGIVAGGLNNVAREERDPHSLLNLYRRLLALHHGNATLRSGSLAVLRDSDGVVVWLRRAPAGARTAAAVLVAVNCGEQPVTLSLGGDLAQLHLPAGELRSLLPGVTGREAMSSDRLTLPSHGIFVGELYHGR